MSKQPINKHCAREKLQKVVSDKDMNLTNCYFWKAVL